MAEHEQVGKYTLEERIAVGGMAEVYRACTKGVGGIEKMLAIKRLHPQFAADEDFVRMLVNEARIAVQLNHKNICQVFDLERHDQTYFIAMEYIRGRELSRLLRRFKDQGALMPLELALYITQEICSGLSYAHRKLGADGQPLHIIHRDMSPQNVLLSFEGEVKIIDFGIARAARSASFSRSGQIKGKFQYMAPEQARGDQIDQRADVFAAGAILYELVTGARLYDETDELRLMKLARMGSFAPPSALRADIPPHLEKIILKATARDLQQRFTTAQKMQVAVTRYLYRQEEPCDSMQLSQIMHHFFEEASSPQESALIDLRSARAVNASNPGTLNRSEYQRDESSSLIDLVELGLDVDPNPDDALEPDPSLDLDPALLEAIAASDAGTIPEGPAFSTPVASADEAWRDNWARGGPPVQASPVEPDDGPRELTSMRRVLRNGDAVPQIPEQDETILDIRVPDFEQASRRGRSRKRPREDPDAVATRRARLPQRPQPSAGPSPDPRVSTLRRAELPGMPSAPDLEIDSARYSAETHADFRVVDLGRPPRDPERRRRALMMWALGGALVLIVGAVVALLMLLGG